MTVTSNSMVDILAKALSYKPSIAFVCFSGGDDSLAMTHLMMNVLPIKRKVLHINTGIGIERTREFVRETCDKYGWPLLEVRAKEDCGQDYDEIVKKFGFPGPALHGIMYTYLKERAIRYVVRTYKLHRHDKIMFVTGIRKDESVRRMRYTGKEVTFCGAQLWVNVLYHYDKSFFMDYIRYHGIKRNPVAEILGMSGECLCGAYAHKGEKSLVRIVCPETAARIERLEREVQELGVCNWGWEDKPTRTMQKQLDSDFFMPMCVGCEK